MTTDSADGDTASPPPAAAAGWGFLATGWRRILQIGWIAPGVVILAAAVWIMPWAPRHWLDSWFPGLPGKIIVDSPEVYTRERLINDRLEEHLWLNAQLKQATTTSNIFDGYVSLARRFSLTNGTGQGAPEAAPAPGGEQDRAIAFDEEFRLRSAVRDQIRQRILENQLDDRHDLFGNSLYVLKFDATIVPSSRPGERAYVRVFIDIPGMYKALKEGLSAPTGRETDGVKPYVISYFRQKGNNLSQWLSLFEHWRDDLKVRLNDAVAKEYDGFFGDRWLPEEYDELRRFLRGRIVAAGGAPDELLRQLEPQAKRFEDIENLYLLSRRLENDPAGDPSPAEPAPRSSWRAQAIAADVGQFIGARTIRLVLGVQLASTDDVRSLGDSLSFEIEPLNPYVDIYLSKPAELRAMPSFKVFPHNDQVFVVGDECARTAPDKKAPTSYMVVDRWADGKVVYAESAAGFPEFRVTRELYEVMLDSGNVIGLSPGRLPNLPLVEGCGKVEVLALSSGLFSFIDRIAQADVYSYAVLPRQSVRATVSDILNRVEVEGGLFQGGPDTAKGVGVSASMNESKSGAMLRSTVTSFGSMEGQGRDSRDETAFGWIVDPSGGGLMSMDGEAPQPMTESMVAIVSVPAWWEELSLAIETGWIDEDGNWTADRRVQRSQPAPGSKDETAASPGGAMAQPVPVPADAAALLKVVLPNSYEGIDALLLQVKRRKPVIVEADFEQTTLTACTPARILIRGNRLWRNSVVTLGAQEATEIKVMPNMEGILARFDRVEIPDQSDEETLRVWTSEGMAELRQKIAINIPASIAPSDRELRRCPASLADEALGGTAKAD